ncbi:MAG: ATP-binding protein [Clostridiales bacterium]|nr:ATP-binding protein [Clostridiales bacterium]
MSKRMLALALALALLLTCATCAVGEEAVALRRLTLGTSSYSVMVDDSFVEGDMTEEDIADGQVGYYRSDDTTLDFDVYQFSKEGIAEELSHYTLEEANEYDNVSVVHPCDEINGIPVGWYRTVETYEDDEYDTLTYIMDNGDDYVELVFWMEDGDDEEHANAIISSLSLEQTQTLTLGDSPFTVEAPADYVQGGMTPEDMADDQVNYYYSDLSLMDFDVYQFSKAGLPETLAEYVEDEASEYAYVYEVVKDGEINGIPVGWYRTVEEFEDGEYETITYVMDDGDEYVEIVFWLDGFTAESEAHAIIGTLTDTRAAAASVDQAAALPEGVTPVTWDVSADHLMIETDEARALYDRIMAEDYPTMEELKENEVIKQMDALSAYYKELYGNTAEIDTRERNELRAQIIADFLATGSARTESVDENGRHHYVYDGPLNRDYQMELVLGLPASGKSTLIADPDSEAMGAFILDVDVIKSMLPEYQESHGAAADSVHFEGMAMLPEAIKAFTEGDMKGVNVILPLVSNDLDQLMEDYIKPFEAAGYNVKVKYRDAVPNEAMARVFARALRGGQLINSPVVLSFGDDPGAVYEELKGITNAMGEPYVDEDAELEEAA